MGQRDRRIDVDLSIARTTATIIDGTRNTPFTSWVVWEITDGASASVGTGQGADLFRVKAEGDGWQTKNECDPVTDGLYVSNVAQPGATLQIALGMGSQLTQAG